MNQADVVQATRSGSGAQQPALDEPGEAPTCGWLVRPDRPEEAIEALDLSEAVSVAMALHRQGYLDGARQLYERVLAVMPEHPDALHFIGLLAHQMGDSAVALAYLQRALDVAPSAAGVWKNMGNVLLSMKRYDEAGAAYDRCVALDPQDAGVFNNLGALRRAQNRRADAESALRRAIELKPDFVDAHNNLGNVLRDQGKLHEAVEIYCRAITLSPRHPECRKLLAIAHQRLGELDKAAAIYREWLELEPDNPVPGHHLAACTGAGVPDRASDAYVEATFDLFADSFDTKLESLHYRAPEIIADTVANLYPHPDRSLDILDAGCGTGLCGPLLAGRARRLVGVDLSGEMLARARPREVYDALHKAELTAFLGAAPQAYDLVVSADTLCYFGDLSAASASAFGALRPLGRFVFTVEACEGEARADYLLQPHGRYCHAAAYVQSALMAAGFGDVRLQDVHLRMEAGQPVNGFVVTCRRPAQTERS